MEWIALDLGSTHTKCAVINHLGEVIHQRQQRTPPNTSCLPGRHETDAEAYFQLAYELLCKAVTVATAGIILSTQMHGYVLSDAAFMPVSPFVSWQDRAANEANAKGVTYLDALSAKVSDEKMACTGVPLKVNLAMSMLYARMHTGTLIAKGTLFNTLGGYVIGRLTGNHVCHSTNAAPTGMYNMLTHQWDRALIDAAGLDMLRFGRVLVAYQPAGYWRHKGREIPVMPDVGDHQVCVCSSELPRETGLHINIGTAGLLGSVTGNWSRGGYEMRPWLTNDAYLQTVSGLPGGKAIDSLDESEYPKVAEAYREAALRMGRPFDQVGFSGGCALHNGMLRNEILHALDVPQAAVRCSGVMHGMSRLAQLAKNTIST